MIYTLLYVVNCGNPIFVAKGRPPKVTTPEEDETIVLEADRAPFTTAVKIRETMGLACSTETVRKRLKAAGIKHRVPAVKGKFINFNIY